MADSALSIRLTLPSGARLGPGKADLLEAIQHAGTVGGAAEALGMSYPRALKLIGQLNEAFKEPLVQTSHGGKSGGGASLTEAGIGVLTAYRSLQSAAAKAGSVAVSELNQMAK
jgi:molybdate transport system regulatory protein